MKLHLYQFKHPRPESLAAWWWDSQYVISTLPIEEVREFYSNWDSGDIPYEVFKETFINGIARQINSLEDIKDEKMPAYFSTREFDPITELLPYDTGEEVNCEELGGKYLGWDISIGDYFSYYHGKEFSSDNKPLQSK